MSTPPIQPAPIELCPFCYRVMNDLSEFDARANMAGIDNSQREFFFRWDGIGSTMNVLMIPFALLFAHFKQRRLDRILQEFPYSLYCANCGHITKRRFPPPPS